MARKLRPFLSLAHFWLVLLAVLGSVMVTTGVVLVVGIGWGCLAFGALCIAAADIIRKGMSRV